MSSTKKYSWKDFFKATVVDKYKNSACFTNLNMSRESWKSVVDGVVSSYLDDDAIVNGSDQINKLEAISPLKLINPFKLLNNISVIVQFALAKGVDTIFPFKSDTNKVVSHSIAKRVKQVMLFPFRIFSTIMGPLAAIHKSPPLAKSDALINKAIFGHEMSPLGERAHAAHLESTAQVEAVLGIPSLTQVKAELPNQPTVKIKPSPVVVKEEKKVGIAGMISKLDKLFSGKKKNDLQIKEEDEDRRREAI